MNAEIAAVIEKTSVMKSRLGRLVTGFDYPTDEKSQILLAYHSIMAEHHSAIFLLIQNDLCGSAFALVRPVYELLYRAHWLVACANDKHITGIFDGKDVFPKMPDLVIDIDRAYQSDGFWGTIKEAVWSPMNDYTHSGIRQIGRRFTGNEVMQNYEIGEILEVLNGVNVALILTAHLFFNYFNKAEACCEVEELFTSYTTTR
jgi:hypothetical protein